MKRCCLIMTVFLSTASYGIPVHDPINYLAIMREVKQAKQNFLILKNQYDMLKKQWQSLNLQQEQLKKNYQAMTESTHWGHFANRFDSLRQMKMDPSDQWGRMRDTLSKTHPIQHKKYEQDNGMLQPKQFEMGSTQALAKIYALDLKTNQIVTTLAAQPFNRIDQHVEALNVLTKKIDASDNKNIKSAIDLNTRMTSEGALIQIDMIQLLSLLVQQTARVEARTLNYQSLQTKFNQTSELPITLRRKK